jgi:hypothetical protein
LKISEPALMMIFGDAGQRTDILSVELNRSRNRSNVFAVLFLRCIVGRLPRAKLARFDQEQFHALGQGLVPFRQAVRPIVDRHVFIMTDILLTA